jgi:hypothetical protein
LFSSFGYSIISCWCRLIQPASMVRSITWIRDFIKNLNRVDKSNIGYSMAEFYLKMVLQTSRF